MSGNLVALKRAHEAEPALSLEIAHIYRSRIVDKCAEAERYVLRLLRAGGGTSQAKAPLSQKLENLKKLLSASPLTLQTTKLRPLLDRLEPLSDLRSELVHSTMSIAEVEGERVAVLRNAAEPDAAEGTRTIINLQRLKRGHEELSRVVNSLKQEAERTSEKVDSRFRGNDEKRAATASAPPPPEPDAAAGP